MSQSTKLVDMLVSAGVDPNEALERANSYNNDNDAEDKLNKSIEVLEEVAYIQREAEDKHYDRLKKARTEGENDLAEAIIPALDDLLTEQRSQNEALAKGLTGVLELVKSLRSEVVVLRERQPNRKNNVLAKSLDIIPSPQDEAVNNSRDDLFKVLSNTLATSPDRAGELMQATALLEGGAEPSSVASKFNL